MGPQLDRLVKLQSLDSRARELQKEIAALPKHIAASEKALDSHLRKLEADRAALAANQKDRKKLEGDIQVQEQKISKLKDQMLEAKTNEQYRAFQHEIEFCEQAIRKAEDEILDLMAESEPLEANATKAEAALDQERHQVEAEKTRARERTAADQKALETVKAERAAMVADLDASLYNHYERIRKKWHGVAVAEVVEGRCTACQIVLRPQLYQDLRKGEEVLFCESCGRILFYNPPVSFEDSVAAHPTTQ